MDRDQIVEALTALAAELTRRGTSAEMYVVGGFLRGEDPAAAPVLDLPGLRRLARDSARAQGACPPSR